MNVHSISYAFKNVFDRHKNFGTFEFVDFKGFV